ncbi:hypothetical protein V6N13_122132 [Hibiscus sabdariffa]
MTPKSMFLHKLPQKSAFLISAVWFANHGGFNQQPLAFGLSLRKFKGRNPRLACRARFDGFSDDESGGQKSVDMNCSMQIFPSNVELLDPGLLGIWPDPPDWPERDEVCRMDIEQKAKCFGIPHSLRMIKRKQKWKEGFVDAGEFAYCSVKKAFSSLVLIIREIQSYTLVIREGLNCEDLIDVMNKMQRDLTLTFVWLFQQVFSKTPTLMVYVMLLLANFSVHSMTDKAFIDLCQQPIVAETDEHLDVDPSKVDGEVGLWKSMVEQASRMQGEVYYKVIDSQIRQQLVSPLNVQIEPDNNDETNSRMNLIYQTRIAEEPENALLLLNYAQFLYLVVEDHDRAEEYFKRAIQVEPQDPEALEQYADFLWKVRNDHPEAEERYLEALEADVKNPFRASNSDLYNWEGFWYRAYHLSTAMAASSNFKAKDSNVFLPSSIKTGTTWLKALIPTIMNPNVRTTTTTLCSSTILMISPACRVRDYFERMFLFPSKGIDPWPMDEAFESFCRGIYASGPFHDHVLGYWKESRKRPEKIHFMKFEGSGLGFGH